MAGTISISLQDIKQAQQRIKGKVNRTPLVRFYSDECPGEIYLKLENLVGDNGMTSNFPA